MKLELLNILKCPICHNELIKQAKIYTCINTHSFDIAREGYVNLLLPNQKNSKNPGDSKDMIDSRRAFLYRGYYLEVSNKLNEAILKNCDILETVLDIGCGEGYYLTNFVNEMKEERELLKEAYGLDISKEAIRLASKRAKNINWIVGNAFSLPFKDNSIDLIICMFSMVDFSECRRVLKTNGKLIFVSTAQNHLKQLREIIYSEILESKESNLLKSMNENFNLFSKQNIQFDVLIKDLEDIKNLLKMTPHYWKIKENKKQELYNYSELNTNIDINIEILT